MESAPFQSAPDITASLRLILRGLMAVLGGWRLEAKHAVLLHGRIGKVVGQIERMLTRFRAGKLRQVMQQQVSSSRQRRRAWGVLPRKFGWLILAGKHQAAGYGSQLQAVLNEPEMVALLAASAQARRVLRPLCRALAVELPWTVTPPRPPRPRTPRKPRPKPEPFTIPLPRGVLSAARRQGFGKLC